MGIYYSAGGGLFYLPSITETDEFCKYLQKKLNNKFSVHVHTNVLALRHTVCLYDINMACCSYPAYEFDINFAEAKPEIALILANEVLKKEIAKVREKHEKP